MKRKAWLDLLIVAITPILSTAALADCRLDPREVHFSDDSAARMKSYTCALPGAGFAGGINVEFYDFTVQAASMIASGHPPSTILPILGRFSTVKTKTLDQFKSLADRYGISLSFDAGTPANVDVSTRDSSSANGMGNTEVGKFNTVRIDHDFEYPAIERLQLEKHVIPDRMKIFYVKSDGFGEFPHAIFWRYATLQDIVDLPANARATKSTIDPDKFFWMDGANMSPTSYNKYLELLRYLSNGKELPTEFLILYGFFGSNPEADNCGDTWHFEIESPRLALETMLIRNTSSQDIRVDSLLGEETGDMRLRRLESSVTASTSRSEAISVGTVIRQGEALLVPYRTALQSNFKLLSAQAPRQAAEVYQQLAAKGIKTRPDVYATPTTPPFAFGTELRIAGLVVNGNPIQLSARSSNFVDVSFGMGTGSCPYLLSWDEQRRDWVEHGKVLHRANEQRFESTQSINLSGLVSRFRLEERESEVTTLDRAELFLTLRDGEQVAARPVDTGGRGARPLLVFWGEAQELAFGLPPGVSAEDVTRSRLVLTGYYRRYSSFPNVSRGDGAVYLQATVPSEATPDH